MNQLRMNSEETKIWIQYEAMYSTMQFLFLKIKHVRVCRTLCQTSKMESFPKLVNGFHPLTVFVKQSILDVWKGSEYASEANHKKQPGKAHRNLNGKSRKKF